MRKTQKSNGDYKPDFKIYKKLRLLRQWCRSLGKWRLVLDLRRGLNRSGIRSRVKYDFRNN